MVYIKVIKLYIIYDINMTYVFFYNFINYIYENKNTSFIENLFVKRVIFMIF